MRFPWYPVFSLIAVSLLIAPGEDAWSGQVMRFFHEIDPVDNFAGFAEHFGTTYGIIIMVALCWCLSAATRPAALALFPGVTFAGLTNGLLKVLIRRQRPEFNRRGDFEPMVEEELRGRWFVYRAEDMDGFFDQDFLSYPSGHSVAAVYLALVLSYYFPRAKAIWWTLAGGCMMHRLVNARHYPGDLFAGAAVGIVFYWLMRRTQWPEKLFARIAHRFPRIRGLPNADSSPATPGGRP